MTPLIERTVLFADLRGSTSLYEVLGNADATAVVTQSVAMAARIVSSKGGSVIKTLGDGLMAMFTDVSSAILAAHEMHESVERIDSPGMTMVNGVHMQPLKLQVALALGEVIELDGDVFGDAVNVAARLLDHAGDNETLVTSQVFDRLDATAQERFRYLDRIQLRGRVEPVQVHLLEAARTYGDASTETTAFGDLLPFNEPEGIRLVWMQLSRIYSGASLPIVLGRSPQAAYCIDDTRVSRSHARIDWHGGAFQLTDLSYNGTYVRFDNDREIISLRRGSCTLHGSGLIGLGATPADAALNPTVRFEVMRFDDTQASPGLELGE